MLNNCTLMGRLTKDPELRYTNSETAVASFTIACDRDTTSRDGERETDFIDVVVWRGTAEFVAKYFAKGSEIIVNGRLQIRSWKDKDGNNRRSAEIIAHNTYFAGKAKKDTAAADVQNTPAFEVADDGELPF